MAALAQQPVSNRPSKSICIYSHILEGTQITAAIFSGMSHKSHSSVVNYEEELDDDVFDIFSNTTDNENTATVDFNYPPGSNVRQRYNIEANFAETAATGAVSANGKRKHTKTGRGRQQGDDSMNNCVYSKHQDINQLCKAYSNRIESTAATTNQLMSVLLTSLQHPLQQHNQNVAQSSTSLTSVTQSSPSTKNAKHMNRIKELEAFISTLKENKSKLPPDDPDVSWIEEQLEMYRKAVQNLEDEMFGTAD